MEALNFLKFWRPSSVTVTAGVPSPIIEVDEEEEDSFFDLDISVNDTDREKQSNFVVDQQQPTPDVFSKRKIIPIEPTPSSPSSKPQSPMSLLKPSAKFRPFNKSRKTEEAEMNRGRDTLFSLTRVNSVNGSKSEKKQSSGKELALSDASVSKRFSKDTIQRYLKRIKPLYVKASKNNVEKSRMLYSSPVASPSSSPAVVCSPRKERQGSAHSGIRAVCKNLGKSKSSPATFRIESPARMDDSLTQQNDGIQSAILHCKRSFNSSRESSMLSRSSSDSIKSLSSDCSVLSRYSSDKWTDSARNSIEEGCIISM